MGNGTQRILPRSANVNIKSERACAAHKCLHDNAESQFFIMLHVAEQLLNDFQES